MENPEDDPRQFAHAADSDSEDGTSPVIFGNFLSTMRYAIYVTGADSIHRRDAKSIRIAIHFKLQEFVWSTWKWR